MIQKAEFTEELKDAFFKNIIKTYRSDGVEHCWLWHGQHQQNNYGIFNDFHASPNAHRFSYMIHKGEIPDGMTVDHICEIRCCMNPDHMELKTQRENYKMIGRRDTIRELYNRTNNEYDVMDTPDVLPRFQQCIEFLERRWVGTGDKFKDYIGDDIGKKTVLDILAAMLRSCYVLFPLTNGDGEEIHGGYKKKWYWYFIHDQIEWYGDIPLKDIFEYYRPELEQKEYPKWHQQSQLDRHIAFVLDSCERYNYTSKHQMKIRINQKLDEVNKMLKDLENIN